MTRLPALVLAVTVVAAGCGGGNSSEPTQTEPAGTVPAQKITGLGDAARAADCELTTTRARSRDHVADIDAPVDYDTNPPTTGKHFQAAAQDGIYQQAAPDTAIVHSHEHGRVVFWYRPSLPREGRTGLRALVEEDGFQMLLMPRSEMPFEVAATAWNQDPRPQGAGRLLGCRAFSPAAYDALRAFRDAHRGRGPEAIP